MAGVEIPRGFIGQWYSEGLVRGRLGVTSTERWVADVSGEGASECRTYSGCGASETLEQFDTGE
jgi:hypothetical protein